MPQVTDLGDDHTLSPPLVRVTNESPRGVPPRPGLCERHLIPFVPEIFVGLDPAAQEAFVNPPEGLLELGRRRLLIDLIGPRLLEIAGRDAEDFKASLQPMPTRAQLERIGESRLVKIIVAAGGFAMVAQKLGLRPPRRPNGFWENLESLDEELSLLVAAHWVELGNPGEEEVYFYNPITHRTRWVRPEPPSKIPLDDAGTVLLAEDEQDRVMPSRSAVCAARRWDLHHAILSHGGYRAVAKLLERRRTWPRHQPITDPRQLARELRQVSAELGGDGLRMPSCRQLEACGRSDLTRSILEAGGFHKVAALAALKPSHRPKRHWRDASAVVSELEGALRRGELSTEPGWLPTQGEFTEAGLYDLLYAVRQHKAAKIAGLMGLKVRSSGPRPRHKEKPKD